VERAVTRLLIVLLGFCSLAGGCKKKAAGPADSSPGAADAPKANAPSRPALPHGWVEFHHPDGAFTVFLPSQPRPIKISAGSNLRQPIPAGRALMSDHATDPGGPLYCEVGVAVFSPELVDGVKAARDRKPVIGGPGARRTTITWCGRPAFEDEAEDPESHLLTVQRSMWIGNRLYYVSLYGMTAGRPTAGERATVFDSFTPSN
jgi:hypothetical protein